MKRLIAFVVAMLFLPAATEAHPHIFAKYDVAITQKDRTTLNLHFTFTVHNVVVPHPLFSDRQIDNLQDALHQHPFLLFLDFDGRPAGRQDMGLADAGGTLDAPLYSFDIEVPVGTNFGFSIYDPEYYDAISLAGADSISIKADHLVCQASSEDVGHTMWGVNHASHIECGDPSKPLPQVNTLKKNRFEHPDFGPAPGNQPNLLP